MSERKAVEDRLRKKEQEINALEEKIKAAKVYVQALRDILKLLDGGDNSPKSESILKSGSAVAQARDVILEKGVPVHINEILDALGKGDTREAKASLTSSLAAYVRRGEIFTRPAPNTFGLVELGHTTADSAPSEPPTNFGQTPIADDDEEIPF
ncbi:MAG: hypothetical protein RIE84_15485 [Parvibaculum sp.]|uniref:hypothetical protein n=1 Tax=Parvibaculum sp. TaxID=2024848 RepID=UPI0032EFBE50